MTLEGLVKAEGKEASIAEVRPLSGCEALGLCERGGRGNANR